MSYKSSVRFTPGSREVEIQVHKGEERVLWACGYWDSYENEWLCLDVYNHSLLDDEEFEVTPDLEMFSPYPDEQAEYLNDLQDEARIKEAKRIAAGLVENDCDHGRFKTLDDLRFIASNDIDYLLN